MSAAKCRRDGCEKPHARSQVYCSRDCAPYGRVGLSDTDMVVIKAIETRADKIHAGEYVKPRNAGPGRPRKTNATRVFQFFGSLRSDASDASYLRVWSTEGLTEIVHAMNEIATMLKSEIDARAVRASLKR